MGFFGRNRWEFSVEKLLNREISVQEFVNANEKKTLFYSTPFYENEKGQFPNAMQTQGSDCFYFPAFTTLAGLEEHLKKIGCAKHLVIKGDLKSVLDSLDSHRLIQSWGVVIDPYSIPSVGIPPRVRVQPKCLR